MPIIKVWGTGRKALWTPPNDEVDVPEDYEFLPAGDAALTQAIKRRIEPRCLFVVMEKRRKKYPSQPVGIWAPASLIASERERLAALRTPEHQVEVERNRKSRYEREIRVFAEAIRSRFPSCPPQEALAIATHACKVGSGRVGRSTVAEDPVLAAVIAHIRHQHTDYEDLLAEPALDWMAELADRQEIRADARERVRRQIQEVLRDWQCEPEEEAGNPQS